jgi:parallel beta-helix repeat protein
MDKYPAIRKSFAVGIILLLVGTGIIPSTAQDGEKSSLSTSDGTWWYVGGSGPGNYSTIDAAMEDASNGDTIFVYPGIYGAIMIQKSLHFIGFDKFTTVVNGWRYYAVDIEANDVTLSNFTIQNAGTGTSGLCFARVTNISISNVILRNNYQAILLQGCSNIILDNISFVSNSYGIDFWDGKNCTISYCTFDNAEISHTGFGDGAGCSLFIRKNIFINNSGIYLGYKCIDSRGNTTIESNLFQNNACAISIVQSKGVNIWKNNFINNTQNVAISQESLISQFPMYSKYRQHWMNNYWDDWDHKERYPIPGIMTLSIGIPIIFHFQLVLYHLPILRIPYKEYDPAPAEEPYDIPG